MQQSSVFMSLQPAFLIVGFIPVLFPSWTQGGYQHSHDRLHVSSFSSRRNDWACLSQHSQSSPEIDLDWRSLGDIPSLNQSLESGGGIGLIFVIFSTFERRNKSASHNHTGYQEEIELSQEGKRRNTCLEGNQFLSPLWSPLSRHLNHNCPGRILSMSLHGLREHLAPPTKKNKKLVKIAIRSNFPERKHRICLPTWIVYISVISQSFPMLNTH